MSAWNDERIALLKKLHADGMSFERMTVQPGFKGLGFTRSAMIGKANRLGLAKRSPVLKVMNHKAATPKTEPVWTATRDKLLGSMWSDPELSAAQIATRLNEATQPRIPLTKMSIISRAGRLNLGPKPVPETWSEEAVERLKVLWIEEELSVSEIARRMERTWHGISKKAADLGLTRTKAEPAPVDETEAAWQRTARLRQEAMAAIPTDPIRFDLLTHDRCKFPVADPEPGESMDRMTCCGSPRLADKPYCEGHAAIAYTGIPKREPSTLQTKKDGRSRNGFSFRQARRAA